MNLTARGDTTALQPRVKPLYHEMLDLELVDAIEDFVDFDNYFRSSLGLERARRVRLSSPNRSSPKSSATGSNASRSTRSAWKFWAPLRGPSDETVLPGRDVDAQSHDAGRDFGYARRALPSSNGAWHRAACAASGTRTLVERCSARRAFVRAAASVIAGRIRAGAR